MCVKNIVPLKNIWFTFIQKILVVVIDRMMGIEFQAATISLEILYRNTIQSAAD